MYTITCYWNNFATILLDSNNLKCFIDRTLQNNTKVGVEHIQGQSLQRLLGTKFLQRFLWRDGRRYGVNSNWIVQCLQLSNKLMSSCSVSPCGTPWPSVCFLHKLPVCSWLLSDASPPPAAHTVCRNTVAHRYVASFCSLLLSEGTNMAEGLFHFVWN